MLTLTVALDSGLVYVGGLRRSDDQEVLLRNGDVIPTAIEFRNTISSTSTVDMGSSTGLRLSVKPKGDFDANPLLSFSSWTRTVNGSAIDYRATLNTASGGIDRLLGIDPFNVAEVVAVQTTSTTADGVYFDLADASGPVRVWMGGASTTAPETPTEGRLLKVTTVGTENAAAMATKIATAIDADSSFSASVVSDVVTVTSSTYGQRTAPHCRSSGYGVTVLVAGGDETVTDIPSVVLQAEVAWSYSGNLTTTRALRWKVENTNRRASQPVSLPFFDSSNIAASAVLFTAQSLTSPQQAQARANIGAGTLIGGTATEGSVVGVVSGSTVYTSLAALGASVDGGQV
jgi:hypothetical protein